MAKTRRRLVTIRAMLETDRNNRLGVLLMAFAAYSLGLAALDLIDGKPLDLGSILGGGALVAVIWFAASTIMES